MVSQTRRINDFFFVQLQDNLLNLGSELEDELEDKLALELEQNMEPNLESSLLKCEEECEEGNPALVVSDGLTDCTVKSEINQLAKLQENARGKRDILKLLSWPQEGMI
jgi:hypothetical protein